MKQLPLTVRRSIELIGLYFLGMIIWQGHSIITPLVTAFFFSILILPVYRFFKKRKLPDVICIAIGLLVLFIGLGLIIWFFSKQISNLVEDVPTIKDNMMLHLNSFSNWINEHSNINTETQLKLINKQSEKLLDSAGNVIGGAAASLTSIFIFLGLVPIYIFLMLYYKNILIRFAFMWFPKDDFPQLEEGMRKTETMIKSYLGGLLIQITYITFLLGGSLLLIGIKHALLIGVTFAILNLIPYIGALFGNIIGVLLTLASSQDLGPIITVLVTIAIVQFLDNNILMPRIVGGKVKINALIAIIGVFIGGALAGIPGMFLSLPTMAVLKIIFDRSDDLKQWGLLFGDKIPENNPLTSEAEKIAVQKEQESN